MLYSTPLPYTTSAAEYYAAIAGLPWSMWLDSGQMGRYDILVAQPIATLTSRNGQTEINDRTGIHVSAADPFDLLRERLGTPIPGMQDIPFSGGALGYWGYDLARRWINLPEPALKAERSLPDMAVGIFDWAVVIDHYEQVTRLVSRLQAPESAGILPMIEARLRAQPTSPRNDFRITSPLRANFTFDEYSAAFARIQRYLNAGDCYQVNLAQRFSADATGDALSAYLTLRELAPSPYAAFINLPDAQILSASPERFLSVRGGKVETKPIKGTRQRGTDTQHDERLKQDLRNNSKDRAENLMIVDLLRNDLSKSCALGSVQVQKLFEVESYAHVHHLVSTITGELASGKDALTLLRNCFPGGSITGAPKQRAMEIIAQLEPHRRDIYCGAIGYIGWDGDMDSNIAIRTLVHAAGKINFSVGGGIVADSTPQEEYQETLDKAAGLFKMLAAHGGKI